MEEMGMEAEEKGKEVGGRLEKVEEIEKEVVVRGKDVEEGKWVEGVRGKEVGEDASQGVGDASQPKVAQLEGRELGGE